MGSYQLTDTHERFAKLIEPLLPSTHFPLLTLSGSQWRQVIPNAPLSTYSLHLFLGDPESFQGHKGFVIAREMLNVPRILPQGGIWYRSWSDAQATFCVSELLTWLGYISTHRCRFTAKLLQLIQKKNSKAAAASIWLSPLIQPSCMPCQLWCFLWHFLCSLQSKLNKRVFLANLQNH